jgi:hypothetical protein
MTPFYTIQACSELVHTVSYFSIVALLSQVKILQRLLSARRRSQRVVVGTIIHMIVEQPSATAKQNYNCHLS